MARDLRLPIGAGGRDVRRADDHVDALHDDVFRILLTDMTADAPTIPPSPEPLLVSRSLVRVAALAANATDLGDVAVSLGAGRPIEHPCEGRAEPAPDAGARR